MHSKWRRVIGEREAEKARSLGTRIKLVLAMVGVRLESTTGPSSRRGTNTQLIVLLSGTLMPKGTSMVPRSEIIEMPCVNEICVISVVICMEVSAW